VNRIAEFDEQIKALKAEIEPAFSLLFSILTSFESASSVALDPIQAR
jgi:hypothetical protein